jgi:Domain of unknown function (DUF4279)
MHSETPYDDQYATCISTSAWLRVMSESLQPERATALLGVQPTRTQVRDELATPASKHPFKYSGWFLESLSHVQSRDARRHIDWLLQQLRGKATAIAELKGQGHTVDVCVYWESVGQGGPTLGATQMAQLGELGVELWFDIYFGGKDSAG